MIGSSAIFYVFVVALGLIIVYFSRDKYLREELHVIIPVSLGLIVATMSNVFTGKDLEVAVHIGRFVELWAVILLCVMTQKLCIGDRKVSLKNRFPLAVYVLLIASFLVFQVRVWCNINSEILNEQKYSGALNWIKINAPEDSVIFANDLFSSYIPVVTSSYVLFHPNALLQIDSDENIKDRYLVSRVFQDLKLEDIKMDMRKYAGAGYTAHRHMVHNRNVKACTMLHLNLIGKDCGQFETPYSLRGEKYFIDMESKYILFKKNKTDTLNEYSVDYIIFDTDSDKWSIPQSFKKVWSDGRFEIYTIS
jgi:hypothetical protein